jgi:hypothetical protein
VTFPYGETAPKHPKFLATVVRLQEHPCGHCGVAVRFLP